MFVKGLYFSDTAPLLFHVDKNYIKYFFNLNKYLILVWLFRILHSLLKYMHFYLYPKIDHYFFPSRPPTYNSKFQKQKFKMDINDFCWMKCCFFNWLLFFILKVLKSMYKRFYIWSIYMAIAQWRQMRQMPHFWNGKYNLWKQIKSFFSPKCV